MPHYWITIGRKYSFMRCPAGIACIQIPTFVFPDTNANISGDPPIPGFFRTYSLQKHPGIRLTMLPED